MTEYWKSQPRRFCEICKCWFGDNKASIEHHERGMRHKNNVQKRIKEARQKSRDQQEQTRNKSQTLREIERAALKAYEKDLAGDPTRRHDSAVRDAIQGRKVGTDIAGVTSNSSQWTAAAAAAAYFTNPQPVPMYSEGQHVVGRHAKVVSSSSSFSQTSTVEQPSTIEENSEVNIKMEKEEPAQWVRGLSPEGYTYYYNTSTGEATWERPEGFIDPPDDQTNQENNNTNEANQTIEKASEEYSSTNRSTNLSKDCSKQRVDPYGSWTTVRVCDAPDPATASLVEDAGNGGDSSDEDSDKEDFSFKEKTYPSDTLTPISVVSQDQEDKAPAFKKRKTDAKRPQFRKRTTNN